MKENDENSQAEIRVETKWTWEDKLAFAQRVWEWWPRTDDMAAFVQFMILLLRD
ncbi:MAG: hypothetical protein KKB38_20565 [Gammaproteobacteria bacterium]|nr:hypothetical protein [Gammaproteobacteria bacterium]